MYIIHKEKAFIRKKAGNSNTCIVRKEKGGEKCNKGEGPKVPSTTFERNLFLNPVIRITTVIMVFVDIKIVSIVTGGHEAPKAEGL